MSTETRNGITAGDRVILYTNSPRGAGGGYRSANVRYAEVERVTPTQIIVEGIRYKAEDGTPVAEADRYQDATDDRPGGWRGFAHRVTVAAHTWCILVAQIEHPEGLARARELNTRCYDILGYHSALDPALFLTLARDPLKLTELEGILDRTERVRQEALDEAVAAFHPYSRHANA